MPDTPLTNSGHSYQLLTHMYLHSENIEWNATSGRQGALLLVCNVHENL